MKPLNLKPSPSSILPQDKPQPTQHFSDGEGRFFVEVVLGRPRAGAMTGPDTQGPLPPLGIQNGADPPVSLVDHTIYSGPFLTNTPGLYTCSLWQLETLCHYWSDHNKENKNIKKLRPGMIGTSGRDLKTFGNYVLTFYYS